MSYLISVIYEGRDGSWKFAESMPATKKDMERQYRHYADAGVNAVTVYKRSSRTSPWKQIMQSFRTANEDWDERRNQAMASEARRKREREQEFITSSETNDACKDKKMVRGKSNNFTGWSPRSSLRK